MHENNTPKLIDSLYFNLLSINVSFYELVAQHKIIIAAATTTLTINLSLTRHFE
jgi:hypothetical protein